MAKSIVLKEHPYVLECDRSLPLDEQTIFHVIPKTVKSVAESASRYAKVRVINRRKNRDEIDAKAMQDAENSEFLDVVSKISNFVMLEHAPESGYEHFLAQLDSNPNIEKVSEDSILIKEATDDVDLTHIFWAMNPEDTEEIAKAAANYNVLLEREKNL